MPKEINNFQTVYDNLLRFDKEGEFYLVLVLRRRKDVKGKVVEGINEDNRLIKHYFVYDREYLERKKDAIIALCKQNNARAYILPQRRSHDIVMWALHNKTGELLKSGAKNTHVAFGIGTYIANDTGKEPLNIVMKVIEANGSPVAKLSDMQGKTMAIDKNYIDYLCRTIDWRLAHEKEV